MLFSGNFNKKIATINTYSDFDFSFKVNLNYGDIVPLRDNNAIKASIRNLILTSPYERPFNDSVGMGINDYVFDKNDTVTRATIVTEIKRVILTYEPRISDVEIKLEHNESQIDLLIFYTVFDSDQINTLDITLKRLR